VDAARRYVAEGKRWVVDLDLEKFFDRVNHDVLMARVARRVKDKRVLKLMRRYLEAGLMEGGVANARTEGTPQGGPLSPLLSNILLTDLDRELEKRGHGFCRYADDCNIYVGSARSGQWVMTAMTAFLERRLKLKVNADKSAVARPWQRKFLGYSMTWHREPKLMDRGTKPKAICGESAQGAEGRTRAKSETSDRRPEPAAAGMGVLLPAHRGQRCAGRTRWLDQT
jgi:RNA-directed DNA polymerase